MFRRLLNNAQCAGWVRWHPVLSFAQAATAQGSVTSVVHGGGRNLDEFQPSKDAVFRKLFDAHWTQVQRHIACFVEEPDAPEELAAEVFTIAWRKLKPNAPMGISWLLRTADNTLRARARRMKTRDRTLQALTRGLDNPTASMDVSEALAVRTALNLLSAREKQVVVLTYWDELSAGEVAEVLRTSQGAVWTTLTRARAKLRAELELSEG